MRYAVWYASRAYAALWDLLKPYPPNCAIRSKIATAFASGIPFPFAPARKWAFCRSIRASSFFPIAFRRTSASPSVNPPSALAISITCSW